MNDSTSHSLPSLINMVWSFLSIFKWNWWLVLMKSKMFLTQCLKWTNFCYFVLAIAVSTFMCMPTIHMNISNLPNMWQLLNPILVALKFQWHMGKLWNLYVEVVWGVNVAVCKQSKYLMTANDIWNECFNKIYIFSHSNINLQYDFFIIQSKQLHTYNSCEFLSYLQTMWQFLKSNVRSSESPAQKCMGGESWREWRVYGFILITFIKVLESLFYPTWTNMDPPFYHFRMNSIRRTGNC